MWPTYVVITSGPPAGGVYGKHYLPDDARVRGSDRVTADSMEERVSLDNCNCDSFSST